MYKARRRNRVLRIPDEKIEEYKKMGYTITDEDGNTVFEPQDDKAKIVELEREIGLLKAKVAEYEMILAKQNGEPDKPETARQPKGKKTEADE